MSLGPLPCRSNHQDQEKGDAYYNQETEKEFIESFIEHPRILSWTPEKPDTQKAPLRGLFVVVDFVSSDPEYQ